jgi:hypothetical protein
MAEGVEMRLEITGRRLRIVFGTALGANEAELERMFVETVLGLHRKGDGIMLRRVDCGKMGSLYALETDDPSIRKKQHVKLPDNW